MIHKKKLSVIVKCEQDEMTLSIGNNEEMAKFEFVASTKERNQKLPSEFLN